MSQTAVDDLISGVGRVQLAASHDVQHAVRIDGPTLDRTMEVSCDEQILLGQIEDDHVAVFGAGMHLAVGNEWRSPIGGESIVRPILLERDHASNTSRKRPR